MKSAEGILEFARAVLVGAFVASVIPAVIFMIAATVDLGFASDSFSFFGVVLLYAAVIALSFTIVGCIFVGLPGTFILRKLRRESEAAYMVLGGIGGFLLPLIPLFFLQMSELWGFALIAGPIAGFVVGRSWWRSYRRHFAGADGA